MREGVTVEDVALAQKPLLFVVCKRHNFKPDFSLSPKEINCLWPLLFKSHSCKQAAVSLQGVRASFKSSGWVSGPHYKPYVQEISGLWQWLFSQHHFRFAVTDMKKSSPCSCTETGNHTALTCPSFFGIAWICCLYVVGDWNVIVYDFNIFMKNLCLLQQNCIKAAEKTTKTLNGVLDCTLMRSSDSGLGWGMKKTFTEGSS